jgi:hypothetical protein
MIEMLEKVKKMVNFDKNAVKSFLTLRNIIGIILLVIGLYMMVDAYFSSLRLVIGLIYIDESWFIRIIYLTLIAVIGGFLVNRGELIIGVSRILSLIFLILGLFSLILAFWTAKVFVENYYQLTLFVAIGILFFGVMVSIGLFITAKGVSYFQKKKSQIPQTSVQNPPEESESIERPESSEPTFSICPACLSKISLEDTHCMNCGKLLKPESHNPASN